ncbi:MAG: thiamine pyrophosphate-binding protein [Bacteroidales bacterium]|jgi:acetolactate synthase-1/2/3 large subunit|nr:thiamine pyrophosphate-binding protein [Bacteroidales bacterium]
MKASDYIVSFLSERGVNVVFGYIGGMITHLVDSLANSKDVQYIQTYHEQTAAIAAEGYALESGKLGVAICTSGPGATNMMTGIADAYFGSIPVLYISGQVNTHEYKYNKPIRQQGFQETDIVSIVKPITKYAVMIDDAYNLRYELEKAVHIATTGRKGPVVIDLPMDISRAEIDPFKLKSYVPEVEKFDSYNLSDVVSLINSASRPMLLAGGGCQSEKSKELLTAFIKQTQIPVVTSLMGKGAVDETYINHMGMIGSYGNRCANMAIAESDLLLAFGTRLDTRQTGAMVEEFLPKAKIIHVDIDKNELEHHRLSNRIKVNLPVEEFLQQLMQYSVSPKENADWIQRIRQLKSKYNQYNEVERFVENKAPYRFIQALNNVTQEDDIITVDIGQNQMWAAQMVQLKKGQKFITSGGLAPMGFSLPVAIGMAFASPDKTIYAITGDGGLHISIQSLLLISQYNLNIKIIVLNNNALGMITQFQSLYFDGRMKGTTSHSGYLNPDYKGIAKAYGLNYIARNEESLSTIKEDLAIHNIFYEYQIDDLTTVSPKLEYNRPINQPSPQINENE